MSNHLTRRLAAIVLAFSLVAAAFPASALPPNRSCEDPGFLVSLWAVVVAWWQDVEATTEGPRLRAPASPTKDGSALDPAGQKDGAAFDPAGSAPPPGSTTPPADGRRAGSWFRR